MQSNIELKRLLEIEENKKYYAGIRNLVKLKKQIPEVEPYTATQASFDSLKLQIEKRSMPKIEYGMPEALSLFWAWRWGWIILIGYILSI